jgi:hypothetical protein
MYCPCTAEQVDKGLVGDPVEKAAVEATGWVCKQDTITSPKEGSSKEVNKVRRQLRGWQRQWCCGCCCGALVVCQASTVEVPASCAANRFLVAVEV